MKYRYLIPIYLALFLLESTFFAALSIFGVSVDFLLLWTILLPFCTEGNQALVLGVAFGLLRDLCFGTILGPTAIVYFVIALIIKELRTVIYSEKIYTVPLVLTAGIAFFSFAEWLLLRLFRQPYALSVLLKRFPAFWIIELVWGILLYVILHKISYRFTGDDRFYREGRKQVRT